jgi:ABC-type lipoprotein release transport system permease subunit
VERRQQIGVLQALGYQKGAAQFGFLLESSFIALLGIGLGVLLGYALSFQLTDNMADQIEGLTCQIPWIRIIAIAGIAYAASLITTVLPARKAASIIRRRRSGMNRVRTLAIWPGSQPFDST